METLIERISQLFKFDATPLLLELQTLGVVAGGSVVYAMNNYVNKDAVTDVDIFILNCNNILKCKINFECALRMFNRFFERFDFEPVGSRDGKCSVISIKLPYEQTTFQLIFTQFTSPQEVIDNFDMDYVQCGFFRNIILVTKEAQASHEQKKILCFNTLNIKPKRLVKAYKKGFIVPFISDYSKYVNELATSNQVYDDRGPDDETCYAESDLPNTCHIERITEMLIPLCVNDPYFMEKSKTTYCCHRVSAIIASNKPCEKRGLTPLKFVVGFKDADKQKHYKSVENISLEINVKEKKIYNDSGKIVLNKTSPNYEILNKLFLAIKYDLEAVKESDIILNKNIFVIIKAYMWHDVMYAKIVGMWNCGLELSMNIESIANKSEKKIISSKDPYNRIKNLIEYYEENPDRINSIKLDAYQSFMFYCKNNDDPNNIKDIIEMTIRQFKYEYCKKTGMTPCSPTVIETVKDMINFIEKF